MYGVSAYGITRVPGAEITAFASAGFVIEKLFEGPRLDFHMNIPGEFTLIALKLISKGI